MEKLQLCRVCLIDDVHYLIENTQLENVFEKLTSIPTDDLRPRTLCYICYAKLRTIYMFMKQSVKSEKVLTQLLNSKNEIEGKTYILIPTSHRMRTTVIEQNNIESDEDDDVIIQEIKREPDDEMQDIYEPESIAIEIDPVIQIKKREGIHSSDDTADIDTYINTAEIKEDKAPNEYLVPIIYPDSNTDDDRGNITNTIKQEDINDDVSTIILNDSGNITKTIKQENINDDVSTIILNDSGNITNTIKQEDINDDVSTIIVNDSVNITNTINQEDINETQLNTTLEKQDKIGDSESLVQHSKVHIAPTTEKTDYVCPMCSKRFGSKYYFIAHIKTHRLGKPECDLCKITFSHKCSLERHNKNYHTINGGVIYTCDVCQRNFGNKWDLINHTDFHVMGGIGHGCYVCGKRFQDRSRLNRHIRIHTGEKPYTCNLCQKTFHDKKYLNTHLRVNHQLKKQ